MASTATKTPAKSGNPPRSKATRSSRHQTKGLISLTTPFVRTWIGRYWPTKDTRPIAHSRLTRWTYAAWDTMIDTVKEVWNVIVTIPIYLIHYGAKKLNKPLVDIGRDYSVSEMHERLGRLEYALVRQWTGLSDSDFSLPSEEIKQYIAACNVVRQYDRITLEMMARRLDVSYPKAVDIILRLVDDGILTAGYEVTYHDVVRTSLDEVVMYHTKKLEQQLQAEGVVTEN